MTVVAVLLAAGASRRFGAEDKLLEPLNGVALVRHAARLAARFPRALGVVSSVRVQAEVAAEGLDTLLLPDGLGQGDSLAAAVAQVGAVSRLAVFLGDMPLLTDADADAILAADPARPACAVLNGVTMPPAIFPHDWLPRLAALTGDRGAGSLLRAASPAPLPIPAARLRDVDRPADLQAIQSPMASVSRF